jgi:tRNA(Ile)-lysidine synthase
MNASLNILSLIDMTHKSLKGLQMVLYFFLFMLLRFLLPLVLPFAFRLRGIWLKELILIYAKITSITFQRDMLDSFLTFINQLGLDLRKQRTLLTVSGGVDSVVMVHLFHSAGFKAGIAHCNFGLRGEESVKDEEFVKQLGAEYNYSVLTEHFNTKLYAKEKGVSTQMAARNLRYTWFEEVRRDQFDWIATAHHANDSLETVLLNLARGTGIAGLRGVAPLNGVVMRPLLFTTKEEILNYALDNKLVWREDRSNESLDYKRNVIRKKIVPVLKELNPSLEATFQITSEKVSAANTILNAFLEEWKRQLIVDRSGELLIPLSILEENREAAYMLWSVLDEYGFNYVQAKQIVTSFDSVSGTSFYSESHQVLKERRHLVVRKRQQQCEAHDIQVTGAGEYLLGNDKLSVENCETYDFSDNRNVLYLDADKVIFPLRIRNWKHGDVLQPLGMKGQRKKISDILIDLKYSIYQKEKVRVLCDQNDSIIWLIGIRADERWRIDNDALRFYRIERTAVF